MKSLSSLLSAPLRELGFQEKGKTVFFRRRNDAVQIIALECPGGLWYVQFTTLPLFLPCPGYISYAYGRRLNDLYDDVRLLDRNADDAAVDAYARLVLRHLREDLLPQAERCTTAQALGRLAELGGMWFRRRTAPFLYSTPAEMKYLNLYARLYLKDRAKAARAAKQYISHVRKLRYWTDELKSRRIREAEQRLEQVVSGQWTELETFFRQSIEENLAMFTDAGK